MISQAFEAIIIKVSLSVERNFVAGGLQKGFE
jgi:hypothetical protein